MSRAISLTRSQKYSAYRWHGHLPASPPPLEAASATSRLESSASDGRRAEKESAQSWRSRSSRALSWYKAASAAARRSVTCTGLLGVATPVAAAAVIAGFSGSWSVDVRQVVSARPARRSGARPCGQPRGAGAPIRLHRTSRLGRLPAQPSQRPAVRSARITDEVAVTVVSLLEVVGVDKSYRDIGAVLTARAASALLSRRQVAASRDPVMQSVRESLTSWASLPDRCNKVRTAARTAM